MNKPNFGASFSVENIHELREYNYERTKTFSSKDLVNDINKRAEKIKSRLEKSKKERIAM